MEAGSLNPRQVMYRDARVRFPPMRYVTITAQKLEGHLRWWPSGLLNNLAPHTGHSSQLHASRVVLTSLCRPAGNH
jgi:hypothetical protein